VGDGNVLESNVELLGTLEEIGTNAVADGLTLGNELCGIELGNDRFENLVTNGGKDTLVVVLAEILMNVLVFCPAYAANIFMAASAVTYLIDLWQHLHIRSVQHPQCQANHLQILTSSRRRDVAWLRSDVINDASL
jgi:hypothetical protein